MAAYVKRQQPIWENISDHELFKRYLKQSPNGIATIKSDIDEVLRINSYSSLPQYPLIISAALAEDEVFSDFGQPDRGSASDRCEAALGRPSAGWPR